jgi:ParB/RepB/Spo0J family partition protein
VAKNSKPAAPAQAGTAKRQSARAQAGDNLKAWANKEIHWSKLRTKQVPLTEIQVRDRIVPPTEASIAVMVASLKQRGQINPIQLRRATGGAQYTIVTGATRYEAAKELGWEEIEATIVGADNEYEYQLLEITENLDRQDLSDAARAKLKEKEKELYAARKAQFEKIIKNPPPAMQAKGGRGKKGGISEAARKTGISKSTAHRLANKNRPKQDGGTVSKRKADKPEANTLVSDYQGRETAPAAAPGAETNAVDPTLSAAAGKKEFAALVPLRIKPLGKREQKRQEKERHQEKMGNKGEELAKRWIAHDREAARLLADIMSDPDSHEAFKQTIEGEWFVARDDERKFTAYDATDQVLGKFDSWIEASRAVDAAKGKGNKKVVEDAPAVTGTGKDMKARHAAEASNSNGRWEIKPNKYLKGWTWFATDGSATLTSNPGALFATEMEARIDANAAIAARERPTS